jgi:hypothetical protein
LVGRSGGMATIKGRCSIHGKTAHRLNDLVKANNH